MNFKKNAIRSAVGLAAVAGASGVMAKLGLLLQLGICDRVLRNG